MLRTGRPGYPGSTTFGKSPKQGLARQFVQIRNLGFEWWLVTSMSGSRSPSVDPRSAGTVRLLILRFLEDVR